MSKIVRQSNWDHSSEIDWTEISSGTEFTKITAVDQSNSDDFTVEIHGLLHSDGKLLITNVIVDPKSKRA